MREIFLYHLSVFRNRPGLRLLNAAAAGGQVGSDGLQKTSYDAFFSCKAELDRRMTHVCVYFGDPAEQLY